MRLLTRLAFAVAVVASLAALLPGSEGRGVGGYVLAADALAVSPGDTDAADFVEPTDDGTGALDAEIFADRALNIGTYNTAERTEFVERVFSRLDQSSGDVVAIESKGWLARSYLRYQDGQVAEAIELAVRAMGMVTLEEYPDLYVRTRSFHGGLLLLAGSNEDGLRALGKLLAQDLTAADPIRVENARVNYASALAQNGDLQLAASMFEKALRYGLDVGNDKLAISAGSNYVVHLSDQNLFGEVDYWLVQLAPAMKRLPHMMPTASLKLYGYGVQIYQGEAELAIPGLQAFIAAEEGGATAVVGHGYEYLGAALRESGRLEESLVAAERAVEVLAPLPIEVPEAKVELARTLLDLGRYDRAGLVLASIDREMVTSAAGINAVRELALRLTLGAAGLDKAKQQLELYTQSNRLLSDFLNSRNSDYYGAKLTAQRQQSELALVKEQRAMLAAEAKATQAQASELLVRERANEARRNFLLVLVALVASALVLFFYVNGNRRLERRMRLHEQNQNEQLSRMVEDKSQALVDQVVAQSKLEQALVESRRMESIGHLTGNLAHDFNNLLQVVSSANDSLAEIAEESPYNTLLQASNESLGTGASIIRQLLAYSRQQELEATTVGLSEYFAETSALLKSAIGELNLLRVQDNAAGVYVRLDKSQLTSALLNLLRNSVDAMGEPGDIVLSINMVELDVGASQLSPAFAQGEFVEIKVVDSGCGMSDEQVTRALEPFYTTKEGESGTGLGLSSVYGFVKQSGGDISIVSSPGEGTTVTLLFPRVKAVVRPVPSSRDPHAGLAGSSILVVEDNELIAKTLLAVLNRMGARPTWVANTDLAQSKLQAGSAFDFVLSDVRLPGQLDGFELADWVQENFPDIRVLLMSGYGQSQRKTSAHPLINKPFTRAQLLEFVAEQVP